MGKVPVLVEAPAGLGRVWLTAFDVDAAPFAGQRQEPLRKEFWLKVQSELTPRPQTNAPAQPQFNPNMGMSVPSERPEVAAEVQRTLENFEAVQPVSFRWVALFILLYILIVGPLDYFILKRVLKRLELTWITFPAVVIVVSIAAYCTAYALKGDDLRINKIDVVEYDLEGPPQAYGTAWFTLFSPRIQNYTIGLEPSAPDWAKAPDGDKGTHAVALAVLENPDDSERFTSPSLFRQPYAYAEDAYGLERVPIPVWATRTFQARWRAAVDPAKLPVVADLRPDPGLKDHPGDKNALVGSLKNQLPVPLQSISLFYRGRWLAIGDLAPNDAVKWENLEEKDTRLFSRGAPPDAASWFLDAQALSLGGAPSRPQGHKASGTQSPPFKIVKDLMFRQKAEGNGPSWNNSGLQGYDQSWRLDPWKVAGGTGGTDYRDEVILVGRTPTLNGRAETVAQDPASATRLWLDRLPGSQPNRPPLLGILAQETYVRIYLAVKAPEKSGKP
jgi:hypothetical protein